MEFLRPGIGNIECGGGDQEMNKIKWVSLEKEALRHLGWKEIVREIPPVKQAVPVRRKCDFFPL